MMENLDALVEAIQSVLTFDLLKPEYRRKSVEIDSPLYGHCYAASEALFHALGGFVSSWRPVRARDESGTTHWWLENDDGERLDPTAGQYECLDIEPPYAKGRRAGFLTREPSQRAREILRRLDLQNR